jgi:NPCBM-associated, NEW3 domain of alpha-galactosidase
MTQISKSFLKALAALPASLLRHLIILVLLLWLLLRRVILLLLGKGWRGKEPPQMPCPGDIPPHVRRKPDPCLYSQAFLLAQGIPVTWDNPDIQITETDGTPVSSSQLHADHDYLVHGRIWNASFNPALGVEVRCTVRDWGMGGDWVVVQTNPDGTEHVELVIIAPWGNATAIFKWHTPPVPGHFCLRVACYHPDDKNTANNVGQENTQVVAAGAGGNVSARARVTNHSRRDNRLALSVDTYRVREQDWEFILQTKVRGVGDRPLRGKTNARDSLRNLIVRLSKDGRGPRHTAYAYVSRDPLFKSESGAPRSIPEGWRLTFDGQPQEVPLSLAPGESRDVEIRVEVPGTAQAGEEHAFNINAIDLAEGRLGGVTLVVRVQ